MRDSSISVRLAITAVALAVFDSTMVRGADPGSSVPLPFESIAPPSYAPTEEKASILSASSMEAPTHEPVVEEDSEANPIAAYLNDDVHVVSSDVVCKEMNRCRPSGFYGVGEYLLLRPRRTALDYAIIDPSDNLAPQGNVQSVALETRSGYRAGLGYKGIGQVWDVGVFYTYFHSAGHSGFDAPVNGTIFPTATSVFALPDSSVAIASANLDYDVIDAIVSRSIHQWSRGQSYLDVGARIASIDQKFNAFYDNGSTVSSPNKFNGVGLRLGGRSDVNLFRNFGGFVRGGAALMAGNFDVAFRESYDGSPVADVSQRYQQVVPVIDLAVGCQWRYRGLTVGVAYEIVNWFNMVDSPDFSSSFFTPGKITHRISDLSLSGLAVQLGWNY